MDKTGKGKEALRGETTSLLAASIINKVPKGEDPMLYFYFAALYSIDGLDNSNAIFTIRTNIIDVIALENGIEEYGDRIRANGKEYDRRIIADRAKLLMGKEIEAIRSIYGLAAEAVDVKIISEVIKEKLGN